MCCEFNFQRYKYKIYLNHSDSCIFHTFLVAKEAPVQSPIFLAFPMLLDKNKCY